MPLVGSDLEGEEWLLERFKLTEADLYKVSGPLTMTHLMPLIANEAFAKLKDRPFTPAYDPDLPPHGDVWQLLRREDVLISLVEVRKEDWSFGNGEAQYA